MPLTTAADHYSTLGLESGATAHDIRAQIEITRERLGLLKKIPKKRKDAELRLAHLVVIEKILLNPSARADYDTRLETGTETTEPRERTISPLAPADSCKTSGAVLAESGNFCDECGASTSSGIGSSDASNVHVLAKEPVNEATVERNIAASEPETHLPGVYSLAALQVKTVESKSSRKGPVVFGIALVLIALVSAVWFYNRNPSQVPAVVAPPVVAPPVVAPPVVAPPIAGQVTDLRAPQVSLLNHPTFTPSPTASWDAQNVSGTITLKSVNNALSFVYPDGSRFAVNSGMFPTGSAGSAVFDDNFGTIAVTTSGLQSQQASASTWQVQFQASQAKDINGDGFPEIVLSDYSGGAHCCTTITVVSLRPRGPFIIFSEDLGSDGAVFKDIDGDGRREIRYDHLFEYALGDFAHGTFGVPVICSAGSDGVYRVNTRAFAQLLSNEYEAQMRDHQKATYDDAQVGAEEQDRDLINLFFLAYVAGRRAEAFDLLEQLKPLNTDPPSNANPFAILEDALKKVAAEVLQEADWLRIKSGRAASPAQRTSSEVPRVAPPTASEQHTTPTFAASAPVANIGSTPNARNEPKSLTPTSGVLHYHGPPVNFGESITFATLPGSRLRFTFDHQSWQPLISRQADGTQTLTLRSLKRDAQTECEVEWAEIM
jgi:hypothetical protein